MSIQEQAKAELERINFGEEDSAVMLEILAKFFKQWDSGGAVSVAGPVLCRLIEGKPLVPITGADDEWIDHSEMSDRPLWQNIRMSTVFKSPDGRCYDIDDPERRTIAFPYSGYEPPRRGPVNWKGEPTTLEAMDAEMGYKPATAGPLLGCTVCGAQVREPCQTIDASRNCDLPPGTIFVVDIGRDEPVKMIGRRVLGVTEFGPQPLVAPELTPEQQKAFEEEWAKPNPGHITWEGDPDYPKKRPAYWNPDLSAPCPVTIDPGPAIGEHLADIDADESPRDIADRIWDDAKRLADMVIHSQAQLAAEGAHTEAANAEIERLRGVIQQGEMSKQQFKPQV